MFIIFFISSFLFYFIDIFFLQVLQIHCYSNGSCGRELMNFD